MSESKDERQWNMFIHLSLLAGYVVPVGGLVVPIILWQLKKDEFPSSNQHAYVVINWILSMLIYAVACIVLSLVLIGFFLGMALFVCSVVFPIIGGIKANEGVLWPYPLTIKFLK